MSIKKKERWSKIEEQYLKEKASEMKDSDIAKELNKTLKAVREKRRRLGILKKSGRGIVEIKDKNKDEDKDNKE